MIGSLDCLGHLCLVRVCFGFMECSQSALGIGDRIREQKSSNDD